MFCASLLLALMASVVHSSSSQALGTPLGVAYQISFLADLYITIHNSSKISYKVEQDNFMVEVSMTGGLQRTVAASGADKRWFTSPNCFQTLGLGLFGSLLGCKESFPEIPQQQLLGDLVLNPKT